MIQKIIFGLGFVILCLCGVIPANAQDTLTVMTYNIYHGEQAYQEGRSNLQDIASVINKVDPDLVALQEVDSLTGRSAALNNGTPINQIKQLGVLTGMHGYFGKAIDFDSGGYGEGLLSKKKVESKKIMLPIPKGGERRALLMVEYPLNGKKKLIFGGTHLCHQYEQNRVAQVNAINDHFSIKDQPAIIAGDFNFIPGGNPYQIIKKYWFDAAKLANSMGPTYSYQEPTKRIDYIFLSQKDWKILEMEVLQEPYSDHLPIVLNILVK